MGSQHHTLSAELKVGISNGTGAGEPVLNADHSGGFIGKCQFVGRFSIDKNFQVPVPGFHAQGVPLAEVTTETGKICISTLCPNSTCPQIQITNASSIRQRNDHNIIFALYQHLHKLTGTCTGGMTGL